MCRKDYMTKTWFHIYGTVGGGRTFKMWGSNPSMDPGHSWEVGPWLLTGAVGTFWMQVLTAWFSLLTHFNFIFWSYELRIIFRLCCLRQHVCIYCSRINKIVLLSLKHGIVISWKGHMEENLVGNYVSSVAMSLRLLWSCAVPGDSCI